MSEITNKEKEVYNFIVKFKTINGFSPSTYEIATALYTSRQYVRTCLQSLTDKGYIRYNPNKRRCIVVLKVI